MPNPYPVKLQAGDVGPVVVAGELTFTDPANQPGNGGSQPVDPVRLAFAFDTAGLVAGVPITTLHDGDQLFGPSGGRPLVGLSIATVWNGTNPSGRLLFDNGVDASYNPFSDADMTILDGLLIGGAGPDLFIGQSVIADGNGLLTCRGGDVDVLWQLDDGSGGDPGATTGEGSLILLVARAA